MLLSSLSLLFLPITLAAKSTCLPSGDENAINQAFAAGGKGALVQLCAGSVHRLQSPIRFTSSRQTLTTEGNPTGRGRALIVVEGAQQATAIMADCDDCSFATISSLEVDGNRPQLLRIKKGDALIEIGNAEGQVVRDCRLYEPRGWSALHFREGNRKQCKNGLVTANEIGPCGEEWDDEYDTTDELNPPYGSPAADGISLACKDSEVSDNIVYDTTDGAIVLFGSAGSTVTRNTVSSRTRVVLGGVNMVDYDPWDGDYTDVKVHGNSFHADGRYIKVGIVIGPSSWSDDTDSIVKGGTVYGNSFHGAFFGYGIVVSSAQDIKVTGNKLDATAEFSGVPGPRCPTAPPNGPPVPFLINRGSTKGTFQSEFTNGEVQHAICIQPADFLGKPYKPWRFRDDDKALEKRAAESAKESAAASGKLTDAVVKYQSTLMSRLADLEDHIQGLQVSAGAAGGDAASFGGPTAAELQQLTQRIQALETGESRVRSEVESIRDDWTGMTHKMRTASNKQKPLLDYLTLSMASLADGGRRAHASWLSRIIAVIEGIYFGSFGSFMLLTLSGVGIHALLSKAFRTIKKPRHDKVF